MEENEEQEVSVFKGAIKPGIIIGFVGIVITLLLYISNPAMLGAWWLGFLLGIIYFVALVILGLKFRKEGTGYLSFGKAFLFSLIVFVIIGLCGTIIDILLYNVIDPDMVSVVGDAQIESIVGITESMGAPESAVEAQREQLEEDTPENFTVTGQLTGFLFKIGMSAFFAIFTALFIKKKEPEIEDF